MVPERFDTPPHECGRFYASPRRASKLKALHGLTCLSTCLKSGVPHPIDVLCCILVPVMNRSTRLTRPLAHRQRHAFRDVPARRAAFGRGEPAIHFHNRRAVPLALILKLANDLAPAHVCDSAREAVAEHHVLDRQCLHRDYVVLSYKLRRELLLKVTAGVGYLRVCFRYAPLLPLPVAAALLLSGQRLLFAAQAFLRILKRARIAGLKWTPMSRPRSR